MLDLLSAQRKALLKRLNEPARLKEYRALLAGDDYEHHVAHEREAYDTTGSMLHRTLGKWADSQLEGVRTGRSYGDKDGVPMLLLGRWLACADVFVLSQAKKGSDDKWVVAQSGQKPLSAFRVGESLFWLAGNATSRWRVRDWQGTEDPLMHLPYQRKYDSERHGRADRLLRERQEKLLVANDLLAIVRERAEERDVISEDEGVFPDFQDVSDELGRMDLAIALDDIMSMGGLLCLELATLRVTDEEERRIDFNLAEGNYRGALGGYHRRRDGSLRMPLSKASLKHMTLTALRDLQGQLSVLAGQE